MNKKINIGVIGCGSISHTHLQYLTSRNDINLISVCDTRGERAKLFFKEFQAKSYVLDYRELLSDKQIEVVFIMVPQGLHAEVAIAAAHSNKHIFCEKPMAMTIAECDSMIKAIEQAGIIFQLGYVLRFSPDILKLKEWLELIGRPALFRDMWAPSPWASPHKWVFDKNMGGGPLYEVSHWIDLMNFLFGQPKRVYATMRHFKPGAFTAPDTFLLIVDYETGDCAIWSDTECVPGFDDFYVRHFPNRPSLSIIGPSGSIHFPASDGSRVLSLYLNHMGMQPVETYQWEADWGATANSYQTELDYFLSCVKEEQQPLINTKENGKQVIQVIEAAFLSYEKKLPVKLPLHQEHPLSQINSNTWWNEYFTNHWDFNQGSEQTKYYMESLFANLPALEVNYLHTNQLRILDWGCAFGEGTNLLAQFLPKSQIAGLDFAAKAIEEARRRYPNLQFILNLQGKIPSKFDVIITSHVLEHLDNPIKKIEEHLILCKDLYIILVPYDEYPLPEYHRSQLREESFPKQLRDFIKIYTSVIPDQKYGNQLLTIYGSKEYLQKRPSLAGFD
jgi:predicted dehydrogenase/SAM-dependent methyltransferase